MATLVPMSILLGAVETDLPEAILVGILTASEEDVTKYLQKADRPESPVANQGPLPIDVPTGQAGFILTFSVTVRGQPTLRLEGTLENGEPFYVVVTIPADGTTWVDAVPITRAGPQAASRFRVQVSDDGLTVTIDTNTYSTEGVLHLTTLTSFTADFTAAAQRVVIDLVKLELNNDGLQTERVGDYSETRLAPSVHRASLLSRLLYSSGASLVA